jgi:hypothetical protein
VPSVTTVRKPASVQMTMKKKFAVPDALPAALPWNGGHSRGESMDAIRERMTTLPFVVEGLMTLEYEEVYEI